MAGECWVAASSARHHLIWYYTRINKLPFEPRFGVFTVPHASAARVQTEMSGKGRGLPLVHRSLHIASFFTRPGALTGAAATVVDIPRPKGPLVMVPGSVEAERMFSTMTFIKDNLRNRLTTHLSPCARIYSQHTYNLSNFPYAEAIMAWRAAAPTRGR